MVANYSDAYHRPLRVRADFLLNEHGIDTARVAISSGQPVIVVFANNGTRQGAYGRRIRSRMAKALEEDLLSAFPVAKRGDNLLYYFPAFNTNFTKERAGHE